jgi:DinB family protein
VALAPPERCEECGFDAASVTPVDAADTVRAFGRRYRAPLSRFLPGEDGPALVRKRPDATTWSALEYAAHMRDVLAMWGWVLNKALTEDRPQVPAPDPGIADRTAAERDYGSEDPGTVADELAANAERVAVKIEAIGAGGWERMVVVGDEELSSLAIVQKVAHEGHHHLLDVGRVLRTVRGR